nr:LD-carboxypeptidase [Chromobacterium sp. ASV5]
MSDHATPGTPSSSHANRLYLTACSGVVPLKSRQLGLQRLSQAGFLLENQDCVARSYQRFAGSDSQRLADLNQLATMAEPPKLILAGRGGYGAMRLLPHIDYARLGAQLKASESLLIGYSDFSAIQLALLARCGLGGFAGPMLTDFGAQHPSGYAVREFAHAIAAPRRTLQALVPQQQSGKGEGVFWGGNLSVLSSLAGTPYLPDIRGGLLFLEDVGEQPYRVERMLQQLHLAGVLSRQRAIFLGDFSMQRQIDAYDPSYNFEAVVAELRRISGVPVFTGVPFGHIHDKTTLPLGYHASYQADASGWSLSFDGYPTVAEGSFQADALLAPPLESADGAQPGLMPSA